MSFVDSVRGRLRGLGAEPARVLQVAAVLGRRFDWTLLPAAAQVSDLDVMAALRAGVDAQLLVAEPGAQFRFRHALTRDAVLDDLLPAERGLVSRAVLDAVEAAHPALPGQWCEVAAGLAERSGQHERAAALLLELRAPVAGGGCAGLCRADPRPGQDGDVAMRPSRPTSTRSPRRSWRWRGRPTRRSSSARAWPTSSA